MNELEERRSAELEYVASAYEPEEAWCDQTQQGLPIVHRRLSLRRENGSKTNIVTVQLILTMPSGYPAEKPLEVSATLEESHEKDAWDALPSLLESCRQVAESCIGEEAIWAVLSRAEEWVEEEWPSFCNTETPEELPSPPSKPGSTTCTLGRRLIYSHHIIAASKRNAIRELTSHYRLTGYAKIGWPGIILVEGREEDCLEFVDEIRGMTWQYLVVRGEQQEDTSSDADLERKRKFDHFQELDDMSVLAQKCRDVGLESLFRTSMKHYKEKESTETSDNDENDESCYGALVHVDHMNSGKNYRKWLRKTSNDVQCSLLMRQCFPNLDFTKRPVIVVGVVGTQDGVHQFLKRWRSSRVDVDSKGRPCLERKIYMTVLIDGPLINSMSEVNWEKLQAEEQVSSSFEQVAHIVEKVGGKEWATAFETITKV